ncbi:MAG: YheV family putative zinc ribbon protein [Cellvibrionaceae bacterium]
MNRSSKRRFIAGAVCPRCKAMDTIVMYRENERDHRECVNCDFAEQANFAQAPEELPTRVNRPAAKPSPDDEVEIVKIINPND